MRLIKMWAVGLGAALLIAVLLVLGAPARLVLAQPKPGGSAAASAQPVASAAPTASAKAGKPAGSGAAVAGSATPGAGAAPTAATASPSAGSPSGAGAAPQPGAAPTAVAQPGAEGAVDGPTYAVRLRDLEQRIDELKEQIRRSHTRLSLLSDTILSGGGAGSRASIRFTNELSSAFRVTRVLFVLDGAVQYNKTDQSGALAEQAEIPIFNGSVPPGDHTLRVGAFQ